MNFDLSPAITADYIVAKEKQLLIPIYQRLFVWREKQIDRLLYDLWRASSTSNDNHYYLGVITVHENDSQQWEIVDGQQRLTFLTLLGIMFSKTEPTDGVDWGSFVKGNGRDLRLSFHGRSKEREELLSVLQGNTSSFKTASFKMFAELFDHLVDGKTADERMQFSKYCYSHAAFLVNELPAEYGPEELNLYFEKMNATGRQLSPIEVVKGKWFSQFAARWNACMNFDNKLTLNSHSPIPETTTTSSGSLTLQGIIDGDGDGLDNSRDAEKQEPENEVTSRLVMSSETLLLHVLRIINPGQCNNLDQTKLIDQFDTAFKSGTLDPGNFVSELESYRSWMDKNIIYLRDNNGEYDYVFRDDDTSEDGEITEATNDNKMKYMRKFQSMLYVSSAENQQWVLKAYTQLTSNGKQQLTYDMLRAFDAEEHALDVSRLSYRKVSRYWFWKLDYLLWELHEKGCVQQWAGLLSKEEDEAIRKYVFRSNRSIEHLHPQAKENDEWGCRDDPKSPMHSFGNLAMISAPSNSAQSDDEIEVKFGRVKAWLRDNRLESIKMLLMFKLCGGEESKWTPSIAKNHELEMIAILENDRNHWLQCGEIQPESFSFKS